MNKYSDKDDKTLVELTLLGDEAAYEELVTRHQRAVMGTAYKVTGNTYSAEDASQDAFVSAWMNLSSLRDGAKFRPWVCSIAKNCAKNLNQHYRSTLPDLSLDVLLLADPSEENSEWQMISEDYSDLHEAVESLSEKIREAIKLHYFEEKSLAEIAEILSVPVGTVKWRLSEGRKQLRKGYGIMEKTYNENESIVTRVMRQVEALKLWRLKSDTTGFEEEYTAVLHAVEDLENSKEKSYLLADTLLMGYWWLPGEKSGEVFARIKKAAEEGHNDEVMCMVANNEHNRLSGDEKIDFMKNTQIPYYRERGYPKTLAYVLFWLGFEYHEKGEDEEAIRYFRQVLTVVPPSDVYYANAKAAIDEVTRMMQLSKDGSTSKYFGDVTGEVYKQMDDKLYFWSQPGYIDGTLHENSSLFWNMARCDSLILDSSMTVGEKKVSSNGKMTLTYLRNDGICDTPAGHFENCSVFVCQGETDGLTYCETWLCEKKGIVRQIVSRYGTTEWVLSSYQIKGGEGLLPFAAGNRWDYVMVTPDPARMIERENYFEVTACEDGSVAVSHMCFSLVKGYTDTWEGKTVETRENYCRENHGGEKLHDVAEALNRAEELAETKRQKVHTAIANDVMNRIFATDPDFNPSYTEKGRWNFFEYDPLSRESGTVKFYDNRRYSFEWKDISDCQDNNIGYTVLYTFLLTILQDATGCVWSDEWVDGYSYTEKKIGDYTTENFTVSGGETVVTPTGTFENCRHISFDYRAWGYFSGRSEYWFAPGVGIVKFEHPYGENHCAVWQLTNYKGRGEGYFPTDDGLFRRYEPETLYDGWHGSLEYTFDEDESGTVMFKNALGTQERVDYEKTRRQ